LLSEIAVDRDVFSSPSRGCYPLILPRGKAGNKMNEKQRSAMIDVICAWTGNASTVHIATQPFDRLLKYTICPKSLNDKLSDEMHLLHLVDC